MGQSKRQIAVIGGAGHIGRQLVPMLIESGWDVTVVTRGRTPIPQDGPWRSVRRITADYAAAVAEGRWAEVVAELPPGTLIDLLGIDAIATFEAAAAKLEHLIVCGSLWMFGPPTVVPTPESRQGTCAFEGLARRLRQMEQLIAGWRKGRPPVTGVMPSNISGPGKVPIDPHGGRRLAMHRAMARGEPVVLPGDGNTLVGPTDVQDVARLFYLAAEKRDAAAGRMFIAAAAAAVPFNHLVRIYADAHGVAIPLQHLPWAAFTQRFDLSFAQRYHHQQHMCGDITHARTCLGYEPAHTAEDTLYRAVRWMTDRKLLEEGNG